MSDIHRKSQPQFGKRRRIIRKKESKYQNGDIQQRRKQGRGFAVDAHRRAIPTRMDINQYSMFESTTSYILDDFNSIAVGNICMNSVHDRIYNLLKVRPRSLWGRLLKCRCSKSKCEAGYCECFSHKQVCGIECSCVGCNNTDQKRHEIANMNKREEQEGCRCSKSQCLKNYCECFQRGECCDHKCRCTNCRNTS